MSIDELYTALLETARQLGLTTKENKQLKKELEKAMAATKRWRKNCRSADRWGLDAFQQFLRVTGDLRQCQKERDEAREQRDECAQKNAALMKGIELLKPDPKEAEELNELRVENERLQKAFEAQRSNYMRVAAAIIGDGAHVSDFRSLEDRLADERQNCKCTELRAENERLRRGAELAATELAEVTSRLSMRRQECEHLRAENERLRGELVTARKHILERNGLCRDADRKAAMRINEALAGKEGA